MNLTFCGLFTLVFTRVTNWLLGRRGRKRRLHASRPPKHPSSNKAPHAALFTNCHKQLLYFLEHIKYLPHHDEEYRRRLQCLWIWSEKFHL